MRFYSGFLRVLYECFIAFVERSEQCSLGLNNLVILLSDQMKSGFVFSIDKFLL